MTLAIRLNGNDYSGFTDAQVVRDMEKAASTFSFNATVGISNFRTNFIPIRAGDFVEIIADGTFLIMSGYVDEEGESYDDKSHEVNIKGRSKTQDFIDSTVGAIKEFETISLFDLTKLVASDFGVSVVNQTSGLKALDDISSAETGQTGFEFIEAYARKRQVLLTDNGKGELVLTRASNKLSQNSLANIVGGKQNNIKRGNRTLNIANLFYEYIAQSQMNPINATEFDTPQDLAEQVGITNDTEIRTTRRYEFYTEETTESFTLEDRAKWELSVRRARQFVYNCTVQGHSFNGLLWEPNIRHQIDDEFANIFGQFLCKRVIYRYSLEGGSQTELFFTNKNAFTLQSDLDKIILEIEGL
jgi:prophage tail gpP-like protein